MREAEVRQFPGVGGGPGELAANVAAAVAVIEGAAAGPLETLAGLLGAVARIQGLILARYAAAACQAAKEGPPAAGDGLLTVKEASSRLRVTRSWLYHNYRNLPFARKVGPQQLRFSEAGLEQWIRESSPATPARKRRSLQASETA